jgi:hypothetical protein
MWPQYRNPLWALIFLFSLSTSVISVEIARFTEYGWVEAFDRTPSQNGQIGETALGGGAMQVPMNGNSKGWWARWLAVGGEGDVTVHVSRPIVKLNDADGSVVSCKPHTTPSTSCIPCKDGTTIHFTPIWSTGHIRFTPATKGL